VHVVFNTKNREPVIPREIRPSLYAYIGGILENLGCPSLQTGGTTDHVHTLLSLARIRTVADVVEEIKKSSSKWMKQQGVDSFFWQAGYGAFSIGESQLPALIKYVAEQEEHHRSLSFQDEFRRLLERYGVSYDERYVWD
jgi:putative transposase